MVREDAVNQTLPYRLLLCGALALAGCSAGQPQRADAGVADVPVVPLPYHHNMNVWVEKTVFSEGRLTELALRWVENPDVTDRFLTLSGNDLDDFRRLQPICEGDAFEVRHSILQDASGQVVDEDYGVLRRLNESQCQAETENAIGQ